MYIVHKNPILDTCIKSLNNKPTKNQNGFLFWAAAPKGTQSCTTQWGKSSIMLRYITLRYITLCHITLCYVTLHYVMLHHVPPPGPLPQIFHHVMSGQRLQAPSLPSHWHVLCRTLSPLEPLPCSLSIPGKGIAVPYRFGCLLIM